MLFGDEETERLPALFIGRFQPFHKGHLFMIKRILEEFDKLVIGIGSAQYKNTPRNPFSSEERTAMIRRVLEHEGIESCQIVPIDDRNDHAIWVSAVESAVPEFSVVFSNDPITIRLFAESGYDVREPPLHKREDYSGTEVRKRMEKGENWQELVPKVVSDYINEIDGIRRLSEAHALQRS